MKVRWAAGHSWGDSDFTSDQFARVEQASHEIGTYLTRWGRINVRQTKEKYGTARVYCSIGISSWYSLLFPSQIYIRHPKLYKLMGLIPVPKFLAERISRYQLRIYNRAYNRAFKKYPDIWMEIYSGSDFQEFISLPGDLVDKYVQYQLDGQRQSNTRTVMDLFHALREIKGTPTMHDLVKTAKRIKKGY